jgi:hypothetical protein
MAEQISETREAVTQTPTGAVRETVTATDDPVRPYAAAIRLVDWLTSALLALLAVRFALSALGANQGNAFASFIYNLSYPFVAPFFGLFGYNMQYGVARFATVSYNELGSGKGSCCGSKSTPR